MSFCLLRKSYSLKSNLFNYISVNCFRGLSEVRVRFGPSPTGFIHLGGLRTALYNYLFAKQNNGSFILRIEDTDQERVVSGSQQNLEDMLVWCGLTPDEGPSTGGQFGPYIQSKRTSLYREKIVELLSSDCVYRCFCSETRLNLLRKEQLKNRETIRYDNRCRNLTQSEIDEKLSNGDPFTVRLKLKSGPIEFNDIVFGNISIDLSAIEADPIMFKSDGFPTYHFANVVDDHYMKITHVLRGAEWQVSTPKHLMLYEAFGWTPPKFAHLPLILNKNGSKLSKRQSDIRIDFYKEKGYFPETLLNYLKQIGGGFDHKEFLEGSIHSLQHLINTFDINKLNVNNCKIDTEKLILFNRYSIDWYLNNGLENKLIEDLKCLLMDRFGSTQDLNLDNDYLKFLIDWSKDRVYSLKDLLNEEFIYLWKVPDLNWKVSDVGKKEQMESVLKSIIELIENFDQKLDFNQKNISEAVKNEFNKNHSNSMKISFFMKTLRFALTNLKSGPPIAETLELLGPNKVIKYLNNALVYIKVN